MPQKKITRLLYGADHHLWAGSGARLRVTDPNRRNDVRVLVSPRVRVAVASVLQPTLCRTPRPPRT